MNRISIRIIRYVLPALQIIRRFSVIIDLADLTSEQYDEAIGIVRDIRARLSLYESLPDCSSGAAAAASSDRNIFAAQLLRFAPLVDSETLLLVIKRQYCAQDWHCLNTPVL